MSYLWTNTNEIQIYLDTEGTIQIQVDDSDPGDDGVVGGLAQGETFKLASARQLENEAVYEVATFLSMAFESTADSGGGIYSATPLGFDVDSCPAYLRFLVAKFTAAKIGIIRFGSGQGNLPHWITEFENDVFAQLRRLVMNADTVRSDLEGLEKRSDYDIATILMKMKTRSRAVMEDPS